MTNADSARTDQIFGAYDFNLVILSIAVAMTAAYCALLLADLLGANKQRLPRFQLLTLGAVSLGTGIWAMHFIGMIAFQLPVPVSYEPWLTLASVVPGILASAIALWVIVNSERRIIHIHLGGLLVGLGIATMHYGGMMAMQMNAVMKYDLWLFIASGFIAYGLAATSIWIRVYLASSSQNHATRNRIICAVALGCAIAGMHYTGMAAVHYYPVEHAQPIIEPDAGSLVSWVIVGVCLILAVLLTTLRWQTQLSSALSEIDRLIETSPDALVSADFSGRIRLVNRQTENLFGSELLDQPIEMLIPKSSRQAHIRQRADYQKNPYPRFLSSELGLKALHKDGTEIPVEITLNHDSDAPEPYVTSSIRNISERKKAEEERRSLEMQLLQAQKMEAVGRLAGGIAHDFNNLLMGIGGYVELMDLEDPKARADSVRSILGLVDRASGLTAQLLTFSRGDQGEFRVFDINQLVGQMHKMVGSLIRAEIHVQEKTADEPIFVEGNPSQIEQILLNLVINGADAIDGSGEMVVSISKEDLTDPAVAAEHGLDPGYFARLSVSDTGHGITEDQKSRIFDPFYTTKAASKGTGLGLAVVFGIVKSMSGAVNVKSEPGQGTTFEVFFKTATAPQQPDPLAENVEPQGGHETILVVEDEDSVRQFVVRALSLAGYTTLEAKDGIQALECLQRDDQAIDMILTDVILPMMNGVEFGKQALAQRPEARLVYMTGYQSEDEATDPGLTLRKPFKRGELLTWVRYQLDN